MASMQLNRSFTARLECLNWGKKPKPIMLIDSAFLDVADSGWLCLPERYETIHTLPAMLRFDYIEQTQSRIHYKVRCANKGSHYFGRRLDSSLSRFLGFYKTVADEVAWKIEKIGTYDGYGDERPRFMLRDRLGYTVKIQMHGPRLGEIAYLCTASSHSDPLHFTLTDYQPL